MDSSRKQMDSAQIRTQMPTHSCPMMGKGEVVKVDGEGEQETEQATSKARANIFVDFISKSHYQMVSLWVPKVGGGGSTRGTWQATLYWCECLCMCVCVW